MRRIEYLNTGFFLERANLFFVSVNDVSGFTTNKHSYGEGVLQTKNKP